MSASEMNAARSVTTSRATSRVALAWRVIVTSSAQRAAGSTSRMTRASFVILRNPNRATGVTPLPVVDSAPHRATGATPRVAPRLLNRTATL